MKAAASIVAALSFNFNRSKTWANSLFFGEFKKTYLPLKLVLASPSAVASLEIEAIGCLTRPTYCRYYSMKHCFMFLLKVLGFVELADVTSLLETLYQFAVCNTVQFEP